ncbi:MAG: arginine--tRNA ligase [Gammaproteobacteria bacterium]
MKKQLQMLLKTALQAVADQKKISIANDHPIHVEFTKDKKFGDYSSNLALTLAKKASMNPRELAQIIIEHLPQNGMIEKTDIAGPGFINFFISNQATSAIVKTILEEKNKFGHCDLGKGQKIMVEFVSANPTGPLHVGHGRGAAFGASLSNLLSVIGFKVHREYYVNDAGRQMNILATSVWLRYLELTGENIDFPSNGYKGNYVIDIAQTLYGEVDESFVQPLDKVYEDVPLDQGNNGEGDKEAHIDALIVNAKALLGEENYQHILTLATESILSDIKNDLEEFGVTYQEWFHESQLVYKGAFNQAIDFLRDNQHTYEKDGALWFKATDFGDEKDRVVIRENGSPTYFGIDLAYHVDKFERGYGQVLDIFGADHHGYAPRIAASLQAFGHNTDDYHVLFVQFAILYRGGERVQMSTRSGSFVTLRELREEVGNDAARFFYVMRKNEQHMDFDLDLAKSKSNENPVYYIQYAHARICSVMKQLEERKLSHDLKTGNTHLDLLTSKHEEALINQLNKYQDCIRTAGINYEPHLLATYLRELSNDLHAYYNAEKFIIEDENLRNARLNLICVTRQVLKNGLELLGVSAPEKM